MSIVLPNTSVPGATNGMTELSHIKIARSYLGLAEIPGPKHEPVILEMWKSIGLGGIKDDETAWCAAFTGFVLKQAGLNFLKSGSARAYQNYVAETGAGKVLRQPAYGCIVPMWTGSKSGWTGHVGFCVGVQDGKPENLMILAGNQGNKVSIAPFPKSKALAFIWPSVAPANNRFELPVLTYKGGVVGTR